MNFNNGTGFMISPNYIVTAAHIIHQESNPQNPRHQNFQVIRAPEVGNELIPAEFVAENINEDLALLYVENPKSLKSVTLSDDLISRGVPVGSLGFPLANLQRQGQGVNVNLYERFQSAYISGYFTGTIDGNNPITFYETDSLMYSGSSGCPGFLSNGTVFGLHNRSRVNRSNRKNKNGEQIQSTRLSISLWVPSTSIVSFLNDNDIL